MKTTSNSPTELFPTIPPTHPLSDSQLNLAECLSGLNCSIDFGFASTELVPECLGGLARLGALLQRHLSLEVLVEGHAQPGAPAGLARILSRGRALAVCRALVGHGVDPARLKPRAFSNHRPLARARGVAAVAAVAATGGGQSARGAVPRAGAQRQQPPSNSRRSSGVLHGLAWSWGPRQPHRRRRREDIDVSQITAEEEEGSEANLRLPIRR